MNVTASILNKIRTTNNGKLMLKNLDADERAAVPMLIRAGILKPAAFLRCGDAVRLA